MPADLRLFWAGTGTKADVRTALAQPPRASAGQAHWSCIPVGFDEGEPVFRLRRFLVVLCLLVGWSAPAAAHPHVWIVARSALVFDEGKLMGFHHTWTFDPAYSAIAVMGLDSHHNGKPDPDQLAELARTYVESCRRGAISPQARWTALKRSLPVRPVPSGAVWSPRAVGEPGGPARWEQPAVHLCHEH